MLDHIVKNGERIDDILRMYHVELDEVKNCNLHVTDFFNLASGTIIKIPLLSKEVEQILDNTESFVQNYYPKIQSSMFKKEEEVKPKEEPIEKAKPIEQPKPIEKQTYRKAYPGILPPNYNGQIKKI